MSSTLTGFQFIDDLRQEVEAGRKSPGEALGELDAWSARLLDRTPDELDAADTYRKELEVEPGLKSAAQLESLLNTSMVIHINDVLDELSKVAAAGQLDDAYLAVFQKTLTGSGSVYQNRAYDILRSQSTLPPSLRAILDGQGGQVEVGDQLPPLDPPDPDLTDPDVSYRETHDTRDPYVAATTAIELGQWTQARDDLRRIPPNHPRFGEVPLLLRTVAEGPVYDRVEGLRDLASALASARSRRNWGEFFTRWSEAENKIQVASQTTQITMPRSLQDSREEGVRGRDADHMLSEALVLRSRGQFAEALQKLDDAMTRDTRFTRPATEKQRTIDLEAQTFKLKRQLLSSPQDLLDALALCDELLEENATPNSNFVNAKRNEILANKNTLVSAARNVVDSLDIGIRRQRSLEEKLRDVARAETSLDEIRLLQPGYQDLPALESEVAEKRSELEMLCTERDALSDAIAVLDPSINGLFDVGSVVSLQHRVATLLGNPLIPGDQRTNSLAQELSNKLNAYLQSRLGQPNTRLSLPDLEQCASILAISSQGTRPLPPAQLLTYNRALARLAADLVREHLNRYRTLPPYTPPTQGAQPDARSNQVVDSWERALEVLEWLRRQNDVPPNVLESLERDFGKEVEILIESTCPPPARPAPGEIEDLRRSARFLTEFARTLPQSTRDYIRKDLLNREQTQIDEYLGQQRRRASATRAMSRLGIGVAAIALVAILWPGYIGPFIEGVTRGPGPTPTPRIITLPSFAPEARNTECEFSNGFNICDRLAWNFKTFYRGDPGQALLGNAISRRDFDEGVGGTVQYFQYGRLEEAKDSTSENTITLGRLGPPVLQVMSQTTDLIEATEVPRARSNNWITVAEAVHYVRPDHGFDTAYLTDPSTGACWGNEKGPLFDAMAFYGVPITEEFEEPTITYAGRPVVLQFFERAVFEWRADNTVVRWPLGVTYLNKVHGKNLSEPDATQVNISGGCTSR